MISCPGMGLGYLIITYKAYYQGLKDGFSEEKKKVLNLPVI